MDSTSPCAESPSGSCGSRSPRQHRPDPQLSEYHSRVQLKNLLSASLYRSAAGPAHISIYLSYFIYVLIPAI